MSANVDGLDTHTFSSLKERTTQIKADFQTKVLEKHWPDVPRWRDIRTLTGDSFYERTGLRTVDVVSGGFPCQPFSLAGKREGKDDDRYLWPEMLRVIREIRPSWVIGENVPGIINLALDTVLSDLEEEGYTTQAFVIPACGINAPHKRERVCIVAYAVNRGSVVRWNGQLPNADEDDGTRDYYGRGKTEFFTRKWGKNKPGIVGVVDGIPDRVDRIRSLGNAVVPQQFYIFFKLIADLMT